MVSKNKANNKLSKKKPPINADSYKAHFWFLVMFLHQLYQNSSTSIYQITYTWFDRHLLIYDTFKGDIVVN